MNCFAICPNESLVDTRNRDYFANERTFLAYLRTALAFIAFGFVIARFSLFAREFMVISHEAIPGAHISTIFGVGMAIVGVIVALYGTQRYRVAHRAIAADQPAPLSPRIALFIGDALAIIGVMVAGALYAYR
jgi:putative membrane protein